MKALNQKNKKMEKIITKLLEVSYPSINTSILLEIVQATPNPQIATEMLCGLYSEPEIVNTRVMSTNSEGVLTFKSYDKWQDKVYYSYKKEETKSGYFPKSLRKEDVTMENFDSLKCQWKDGETHTLYIPTGKMEERESYMSLSSWERLKYVPTEGEIRQREFENMYS